MMNNIASFKIVNIPIIITGCIKPNKNQKWLCIKDDKIRLKQYIDSLVFYISYSISKYIIFCENSGYNYDGIQELKSLATSYNKKFEWISFNGNHVAVTHYSNKGIGEDEIIDYAFEHSEYLKYSTSFCKITGRLCIVNINNILITINKGRNYFLRDLYLGHNHAVDTRFYICDTISFLNNLRKCYYKKGIYQTMTLEEVYYKLLDSNYSGMTYYPNVVGVSAGDSHNRDYSNEPKFLFAISNILCRLHIFNFVFPVYHLCFRVYKKIIMNIRNKKSNF